MKKYINLALHIISLLAGLIIITQAVNDFDDAKNWLEIFKAMFWLVIGSLAFWRSIEGLTTGKLWWKI